MWQVTWDKWESFTRWADINKQWKDNVKSTRWTPVLNSVICPLLTQVIIRGGGHILPYDQPARSFDMIDRFLSTRGYIWGVLVLKHTWSKHIHFKEHIFDQRPLIVWNDVNQHVVGFVHIFAADLFWFRFFCTISAWVMFCVRLLSDALKWNKFS